ncbi:monovalent cation/H+ antiporter complex subunit F [Pontibacter saemangeumensis]|uniref:Monovalent cation/H+ antiporter complex subunit F n=1 Tax=Pontibacter saemangeumensis TaxID=1084525 RepID=A0ABP8LEC5_9BACT
MSLFQSTLLLSMVMLSLCLLLTVVRFAIGPSLPDRVTAFDLIVANVIGMIAIYTELSNNQDLIDVAMILSLFGFLGSVSFAYYMMRTTK